MNIDAIIKNCKSLETLLERNYKASGKGLHEKISSVESKLPANLVSMLRFVATIRNKAVHEDGFTLSDAEMEIFLTKAQACELLLANIDNQTSNHKPYSENIKQNIVKPKCQIVQGGKLIKLQPFACACGSSISMDYFNCSCGNNFFDINSYSYSVQQGLLFNSKKFYCNFNVEISLSGAKQSELIQYCNQSGGPRKLVKPISDESV